MKIKQFIFQHCFNWRFVFRSFLLFVISLAITVLSCNWAVQLKTNKLVYSNVQEIPHRKVGLLLGTSKLLASGAKNLYFFNRIDATVELYNAGKIDFVLISGDNGTATYNEPQDMKDELVARGIPASKIFLDYAGFRTFDSVVRIEKIFGQKSFTIISQEFHNRRAIYIAKHLELNAIGYNAKDVNVYYGFKTQWREKFARTNMFLDFIFDAEPRFLGDKIEIK